MRFPIKVPIPMGLKGRTSTSPKSLSTIILMLVGAAYTRVFAAQQVAMRIIELSKELVQNRSFECTSRDNKNWDLLTRYRRMIISIFPEVQI